MQFWQEPGRRIRVWQFLFILFSTSWFLGPILNHKISYRVGLISQYEMFSQPYSWLFITGDIIGALLLIAIAKHYLSQQTDRTSKIASVGLLVVGFGSLADALLPTTCHLRGNVCYEYVSLGFLLHATETVITAAAIFALAMYDAWLRKRLASIAFASFQILYGLLFISQLASQNRFNTLSQIAYQATVVVWLAWFVGDYYARRLRDPLRGRWEQFIKASVAAWAFLNGIIAILISLPHLMLVGHIQRFYFVGDNALLAQHSVVVGVVLLYLSRHLWRGERRARQLFLLILGFEAINYSAISPDLPMLLIYLVSFCLLFVLRDEFDRGRVNLTWRIRLQDLAFLVGGLTLAALTALIFLRSDARLAHITTRAFSHIFDWPVRPEFVADIHHRLPSLLLAHTFSMFLLVSSLAILWILFKPSGRLVDGRVADPQEILSLLHRYSSLPDDYFKCWPADKQYFWSDNRQGFIAYKVEGPVAFALANPIVAKQNQLSLTKDFIKWARRQGLRTCFLPVYEPGLYKAADLNTIKIGSSAIIKTDVFLSQTARDKWWRWQQNKAKKQDYLYGQSLPPHSPELLDQLREVSDQWLANGGRQERGFALGYFDEDYLQACTVHYLRSQTGQLLAFANQLPRLGAAKTSSVDLMRYLPEANQAMSYLLLKIIEATQTDYTHFDLGFVPFAKAKSPIITIARTIGASQFSARGLEQFKNKFDPDWQANYLAYDGDPGDLALIALNLERAMKP